MFCKNCGKEIENSWKRCPYCSVEVENKIERVENMSIKHKRKRVSFGYLVFWLQFADYYSA